MTRPEAGGVLYVVAVRRLAAGLTLLEHSSNGSYRLLKVAERNSG